MQAQEYFLVLLTGVTLRFNVEAPELPGIGTTFQVVPGKRVRVVPPEPGRTWREHVA